MTTRSEAQRHLALTQLLLTCQAPASLEEALQHAEEAARAVRALRDQSRAGQTTQGGPEGRGQG